MLQLLPQSDLFTINTTNPLEASELINNYINKHHCLNMSVDISHMNVIDASYVSMMCSTNHFMKYPNGVIKWKVADSLVEELNKDLNLGNSEYLL